MRNKGTLGLKNVGTTLVVEMLTVRVLILLSLSVKERRLTTVADNC